MTTAPAVLTGPLRPHGRESRLARGVLGLFGWTVDAPGLPAEQGVILVYPHTSNWDFVVGLLAKWAIGLQLRFWLAAAPEGTRSLASGWRTGAYQVAVQAGVPVGLAYFDFERRLVSLTRFLQLSGDVPTDFAAFADYLGQRVGKRPALASPIRPRP